MDDQKKKIISDICPFYKEYGTCERCNTALDIDDEPCYWECMANEIIRNNYRKQIEGEWKEVQREWDFEPYFYVDYTCSICGNRENNKRPCCPNCGARMRKEDGAE